ncbi:MAG TPA: hypothetical protein VMU19_00520 [Bryobacteraceae bacterium]|nr:hypothetical protein [Bryobacteraceae bacterium]
MFSRTGAIVLTLASLLFPASSFSAETKLLKAVSDHFELYTTDNEGAAKAALDHFESVRQFMLSSLHAPDPFPQPVRLVAFKSGGDFFSYTPRDVDPGRRAFSESNASTTTILLSSTKKEAYEYGVREYVSLLFSKLAPQLPYWFNLGLSELYSTLRVENGRMSLGISPARDFHSTVWPDFDMGVMFRLNGGVSWNKGSADFYAETAQSGVPNSKAGARMADLESTTTVDYPAVLWQLTHMLMFDKKYATKFGAFMGALGAGQETTAAVQHILGQSLQGLKEDLVLYAKQPAHAVLSRPFQLEKPIAPQISQLSGAESALVLADLKAVK